MILHKPYTWIVENKFPLLPPWAGKVLGVCVLCTSFWMGVIELLMMGEFSIFGVAYNAVATVILYRLMK